MNPNIQSFWKENGYYHAKGVFSKDQLRGLETDFDHIVSQLNQRGEGQNAGWDGPLVKKITTAKTALVHTHNVQIYSSLWLGAFLDKKFLGIVENLIGPDIILHHSKLFQKPAENGAPFPMHQDWTYFPSVKDTMMAGIIHVSDATDEMGCLRIFPGTHRLGRIKGTSGMESSSFLEEYPIEKAIPVPAEAGDVVFFHYFTLHGSMPNRSNQLRKTVLAQMHSGDDAIEEGNKHPNARLALQGWNHHAGRGVANE